MNFFLTIHVVSSAALYIDGILGDAAHAERSGKLLPGYYHFVSLVFCFKRWTTFRLCKKQTELSIKEALLSNAAQFYSFENLQNADTHLTPKQRLD